MLRAWSLLLFAACRFGFTEIADGPVEDAPEIDAAIDASPAGTVSIIVVGHGVVTAPGVECGSACSVNVVGPLELTAIADQAWRHLSFTAPCGTSSTCTARAGDTITVTFQQLPIVANRAFVSSIDPPAATGRAGLDTFCQSRALAGGLQGNFLALVSTSTQDARDRLSGSRGWVRMDGLPIADEPATTLGLSPRAVLFDELGAVQLGAFVMTGSTSPGVSGTQTCSDWTTNTGYADGGKSDGAGSWLIGSNSQGCSGRVYCFETGASVPVDLTPPPFPVGRYVFLTAGFTPGIAGLSGADMACQADATAAGLPGSYKALLATTTSSAADRVTSLAGIWRRPDGLVVTRTSLAQPPYDANLLARANGEAYNINLSYLGAANATTLGTAASTCEDWSNPTGTVRAAEIFRFPFDTTIGNAPFCSASLPVICVQQ